MFSNVRFLTMEENSFAALTAKKKQNTENHFIKEKTLIYAQSLNTHSPWFQPTHFTNKLIACPEVHFIRPLLIRTLLKLSTEECSTRTKLRHLAGGRPEGKFLNSWGNKRKSWTQLRSSFPWSIPELQRLDRVMLPLRSEVLAKALNKLNLS